MRFKAIYYIESWIFNNFSLYTYGTKKKANGKMKRCRHNGPYKIPRLYADGFYEAMLNQVAWKTPHNIETIAILFASNSGARVIHCINSQFMRYKKYGI